MACHHDVVQRVLWLKTKLSSDPLPEIAKIVKLLHKLSRLPVDVKVLQETGIGKCVNGLKKKCPEISMYVKPLIQSWKAVVQKAILAEAEQKQSGSGLENGDQSEKEEEEAASPSSPSCSPLPDAEIPSGNSSPDQNEDQNHFSDRSDEEREQFHGSPPPLSWMPGKETFDSYVPKRERQETSPYHQQKSSKEDSSTSNESPPKKPKISHKFKSFNEDMNRSKKEKCNDSESTVKQGADHKESQNSRKKNMNSSASHTKSDYRRSSSPKHHHDSHRVVDKSDSRRSSSPKHHHDSHRVVDKSDSRRSSSPKHHHDSHRVVDKSDSRRSSSPKHHHDSHRVVDKSTLSKPILSEQHATYSRKLSEKLASNVLLNDTKVFSKSGNVTRDGTKGKSRSEGSSVSKPKKSLPKGANIDDPGMLFQPDFLKSEKNVSPSSKKTSGHQRDKINKREAVARIDKTDSSSEERDPDVYKVNKDKKPVKSESSKKMSLDKHESDTKASKSDALVSKKSRTPGQHSKKSISDKGNPSKSASVKPSMPSKSSDKNLPEERTFENTGMSFEDCLFGGSAQKVVKKSKPSGSNGIKSNSASRDRTTHDDRKVIKNNENKNKLKKPVNKEQSHSKKQLDKEGKTSSKRKSDEGMNSKRPVKKIKDSNQKSEEVREASASEVDLSLPDIQPDYRPLRLPDIKPPDRRKATLDSSDLSLNWFGSKQTKTKVYSGKARKRHWDRVPSLQDICKEVIFDNIDALFETGGVPFYLLEDVLEKCTAQQLLKIEDYNPDYMLESDHLWKKHVDKTFKGCEPEEMESWKDLYVRKSDEREHKLLAITANISASMAKKDTGRLTKLAFVDRPVKPPRNVIRQQIRHGTSTSSSPAKAPRPKKNPVPGETSSHRVVPSKEATSPPAHRQRTAKVVAPMMQKSLKMMKRVSSRR